MAGHRLYPAHSTVAPCYMRLDRVWQLVSAVKHIVAKDFLVVASSIFFAVSICPLGAQPIRRSSASCTWARNSPQIQRFIDFSHPGRQSHRIQTNQASTSPRNSIPETRLPGSGPAPLPVWVMQMEPVPIVRLGLSMLAANFFRGVAESRSLFAG